ncbi:MAG: hypothetical protein AAF909_09920 [Pseudomonadota bacterium]
MARFRARRSNAAPTPIKEAPRRTGPSYDARRAVQDAARDLADEQTWEVDASSRSEPARLPMRRAGGDPTREDPALLEARRRAEWAAAHPPHALSQTNRGLRMILTATVLVMAMSWAATVGNQYIAYLKVQELAKGDPDALRVMCAVNPPTERDIGMMHLCETAAKGGRAVSEAR